MSILQRSNDQSDYKINNHVCKETIGAKTQIKRMRTMTYV